MRLLPLTAAIAASVTLTGCHSAYISATISNHTSQPVALIEVDYPSASFGTQSLPSGQDFHYRFKILGSGSTTLLWTDSGHHDHKQACPPLSEGEEGDLRIVFENGTTPTCDLHLRSR